jgi:hypothetical protein
MSGRGGGKAGIVFSMVGLLSVLVILGVTAAIAIPTLTGSKSQSPHGGSNLPTTGTTSIPASGGTTVPTNSTTETTIAIPSESAIAACQANAQTVAAAVQDYAALHGDSASVVTPTLLTSGSPPFLKSFPSSPDYTISIVSGVVMVAAPKSATPVPSTTATACAHAGP